MLLMWSHGMTNIVGTYHQECFLLIYIMGHGTTDQHLDYWYQQLRFNCIKIELCHTKPDNSFFNHEVIDSLLMQISSFTIEEVKKCQDGLILEKV